MNEEQFKPTYQHLEDLCRLCEEAYEDNPVYMTDEEVEEYYETLLEDMKRASESDFIQIPKDIVSSDEFIEWVRNYDT